MVLVGLIGEVDAIASALPGVLLDLGYSPGLADAALDASAPTERLAFFKRRREEAARHRMHVKVVTSELWCPRPESNRYAASRLSGGF